MLVIFLSKQEVAKLASAPLPVLLGEAPNNTRPIPIPSDSSTGEGMPSQGISGRALDISSNALAQGTQGQNMFSSRMKKE